MAIPPDFPDFFNNINPNDPISFDPDPLSQFFLNTLQDKENLNSQIENRFKARKVSLFGGGTDNNSDGFIIRKRKNSGGESSTQENKVRKVKKAKRDLGPPVLTKKEREFRFNDQQYKIKEIGSGQYHTVNKFEGEGTLEIEGQNLPLSKVVVKFLDGSKGRILEGFNRYKEIDNAKKGYEQLKAIGVPVVEVYAEPVSKNDSDANTLPESKDDSDANTLPETKDDSYANTFWIVEKMDSEITGEAWSKGQTYEELDPESQGVLDFAKHWLTKRAKIEGEIYQLKEKLADCKNTEIENEIAEKKSQIVFDFYRRNIMISEEGTIKVVDFGYVDDIDNFHTDEDCIGLPKTAMIGKYANNWANKNRTIFDWLISDFPEDMKPEFRAEK